MLSEIIKSAKNVHINVAPLGPEAQQHRFCES